MREIRCLTSPRSDEVRSTTNSWAGSGPGSAAGPFYTIAAIVEGPVDPSTGYVCNIKLIDNVLRAQVVGRLGRAGNGSDRSLGEVAKAFREAFSLAAERSPKTASLKELHLKISPFTILAVNGAESMVRLTQSFEFSASHRLHRPELSDEENLRVFGKCSNPAGHGHNYVVDVTVSGAPSVDVGTVTDLAALDRAVKRLVIDDFDHKNLNAECPEFASLNPTVENIARVIWNRLAGRLDACNLVNVRVWETPKTYAEYNGDGDH